MLRFLFFTHRWLGVVLALFMLVWFATGSIIAFIGSPATTRIQQLAHAESLAPQEGWLSLGEALQFSASARANLSNAEKRVGAASGRTNEHSRNSRDDSAVIADARLARVDGAPLWLIEDDRGQRGAISALDGALVEITVERAERIARSWLGSDSATTSSMTYIDTIDAPVGVRNPEGLKPFHRFAAQDGAGTQIIVSARTGEVVQVATRTERAFSYVGNWLHLFRWLDALGAGDYRRDALTWAGLFATIGAFTGLILGWVRWRPGFFGGLTYAQGRTQPYREFWLKYHFWIGLIGGGFALLWATSGFLSTNPGQIFSQANASREELNRYRGARLPAIVSDWKPKAALGLGDDVVELGWSRLGDEAILFASTRDGARQALNIAGAATRFEESALFAAVQRLAGETKIASHEALSEYDSYYYPNHRQSAADKPLPVLRVDLDDAGRTSFYVNPADGRLLAKFDSSRRAYRWLYSAVHHWDFGWLHERLFWNAWMAIWISFGVALSASAVVLALRRLRRTFAKEGAKSGVSQTSALPQKT
jgi:uncharacterized iron-regulated membrane protein